MSPLFTDFFKDCNRNYSLRHFLIFQIGWMLFYKVFPQTGVFLSFGEPCIGADRFAFYFKGGLRFALQIEILIGVVILSPVGFDNKILAFVEEICDGNATSLP